VICTAGGKTASWEEFLAASWVCSCGSTDQKLLLVFRMFDRNNDELVERDDLTKTAAALTCKGSPFEDFVTPQEAADVDSRLSGGPPCPPLLFLLQSGMLLDMLANRDDKVTFDSFRGWAQRDGEILQFVKDLSLLVPE